MATEDVFFRLKLAGQRAVAAGFNDTAKAVDRLGDESAATAKQADKAARATGRASDTAKRGSSPIAKLAKGAVALGAGFASISAGKKAVDTTTSLAKAAIGLSANFGLASETAAQFAVVAKVRGIDPKGLTLGFTALSRAVVKNDEGFKKLGVSRKLLATGNLDAIIRKSADGFARLGPGPERAALGAKLFGKQWANLRPLLAGGSKELQTQLNLAKKYVPGLAGSKDAVAKLAAAQRESQFAMIGLQIAAAQLLIPALTKLSSITASVVGWAREHKTITRTLAIAVTVLAGAAVVWKVGAVAATFATNAWKVAMVALNIVMRANPIGLVVTALAALGVGLVLAYRKSATFRRIVDGAWNTLRTGFGWVKANWPTILAILTGPIGLAALAISKNFARIKSGARQVAAVITGVFTTLGGVLGTILKAPINAVIAVINAVPDIKIPKLDLGKLGSVGGGTIGIPHIEPLAGGTRSASPGLKLVGEQGPEIVRLRGGERVFDAGSTARGLAGGSDGIAAALRALAARPVIIQVDGREIARASQSGREWESALA